MIRLSLTLAGLAICNAVLAVLMQGYVVTQLGSRQSGEWSRFRRTYRERSLWMGGLTIAAGITLLIFGERIGLTGKMIVAICPPR